MSNVFDRSKMLLPHDSDEDSLEVKLKALVEGMEYANSVAGARDCPTGDVEVAVEVVKLIAGLFEKIEHGEVGHREWLAEAIQNHFQGKPMPEYRAK